MTFPLYNTKFFQWIRFILAVIFLTVSIFLPTPGFAQSWIHLPQPGVLVQSSTAYMPVMMKGLQVNPKEPLLFNFVIDTGDSHLDVQSERFKNESQKIINYFLAALTIKEDNLWVNLSPYEADRMIPDALGKTVMGRDMLAQDYLLKQLSSSLLHPDHEIGKEFWKRVYNKAQEKYGTTDIPTETFNKVWIMADKAKVLERNNTAYVVGSHLKVMHEQDYIAIQKNQDKATNIKSPQTSSDDLSATIMKEVVIPAIEKEVNEGAHFAPLRQMFHAMILASWYKMALKNAFLNQQYSDRDKIGGVLHDDPAEKRRIYDQYVEAYRQGAFDLIREDVDVIRNQVLPRHYFAGGLRLLESNKVTIVNERSVDDAPLRDGDLALVSTQAAPSFESNEEEGDASMTAAITLPQLLLLQEKANFLNLDSEDTLKDTVSQGNALIKAVIQDRVPILFKLEDDDDVGREEESSEYVKITKERERIAAALFIDVLLQKDPEVLKDILYSAMLLAIHASPNILFDLQEAANMFTDDDSSEKILKAVELLNEVGHLDEQEGSVSLKELEPDAQAQQVRNVAMARTQAMAHFIAVLQQHDPDALNKILDKGEFVSGQDNDLSMIVDPEWLEAKAVDFDTPGVEKPEALEFLREDPELTDKSMWSGPILQVEANAYIEDPEVGEWVIEGNELANKMGGLVLSIKDNDSEEKINEKVALYHKWKQEADNLFAKVLEKKDPDLLKQILDQRSDNDSSMLIEQGLAELTRLLPVAQAIRDKHSDMHIANQVQLAEMQINGIRKAQKEIKTDSDSIKAQNYQNNFIPISIIHAFDALIPVIRQFHPDELQDDTVENIKRALNEEIERINKMEIEKVNLELEITDPELKRKVKSIENDLYQFIDNISVSKQLDYSLFLNGTANALKLEIMTEDVEAFEGLLQDHIEDFEGFFKQFSLSVGKISADWITVSYLLKPLNQDIDNEGDNNVNDRAMNAQRSSSLNVQQVLSPTKGGIDLDAAQLKMDIDREDGGIDMYLDKAMMATFQQGDFSGVRGIILSIIPITSPLPLLGYDNTISGEGDYVS